jgi:hypothetical protein
VDELVAVRIWPELGAVAAAVLTLVVADFSAAEVTTVGLGYVPPRSPLAAPVGVALGLCHVAVVLDVAVSTCPEVGAVAAEVLTLVVADFSAAEVATLGFGYVPVRLPPAAPVGVPLGFCQVADSLEVAVRTWPTVGAGASDVVTSPSADFSASVLNTEGFGYSP